MLKYWWNPFRVSGSGPTNMYNSVTVILFAAWKKFCASCKCWLFQVYLACDDYLGFDWKSPIAVKLIMLGTLTRNIFDKLASLMRYVSCHYFFNDAGAKYNWILIKGKVTRYLEILDHASSYRFVSVY